MANVLIEESTMSAIGNAIREKTGKTDLILPADMPTEIESIESGGSGGGQELMNAVIDRSITEISSDVETIGYCAFSRCESLTIAKFEKATSVKAFAFEDCEALKTVIFTKAPVFSTRVFYNCSALVALIIRDNTAEFQHGQDFLTNTGISAKTGYIYVPRAMIDSYTPHYTSWLFRALEDYTVDGTVTGELDETKIST